MIIRQIDSTGDWTFGKGLSNYAALEQAINQNIKTRILSWLNDCFFALEEGIDWKSRLDVGQQAALEEEIRLMILQSYGVVGINSFEFTFDGTTRAISIEYDIQTIYSPSFQSQITQAIGS
jgi:hypothetical protein